MGHQDWYSWCVAKLVMLATGAQAQDTSRLRESSGLTAEKVVVSQEAYRFKAYDCNQPEDALIQNAPQGCTTEGREAQPQKPNQAP